MKSSLLVTLADEKYLTLAKQALSSAEIYGKWNGDRMLMTKDIPEKELKWFKERGILIKKLSGNYHIRLGKFYLFTPEFKKWKNIIFIDADTLVMGPIKKLGGVKGFWAVASQFGNKVKDEFKKEIKISKKAFSSGIMAFSTEIIKANIFDKLMELFKKYHKKAKGIDQPILNLYFNKWKELSRTYNLNVFEEMTTGGNLKGKILHFIQTIPDCGKYHSWKRHYLQK